MTTTKKLTAQAQDAFQNATLSALFDRLTRVTTWSCLTYSVLMLAVDSDPMRVLATMIIAAGGPLCNYLRRTTNARLGFSAYLWSIFFAIVAQSAVRGGLANPVLQANVVLILMGGWLLGVGQAFWFLLVAVGWIGVLTMAGIHSWWTPAPSATGLGYWISMAGVWVIGYLVMRLVLSAYQQRVTDMLALDSALREKIDALTTQERATRINEQKVTQVLMASPLPITVAVFKSGVYVDVNPAWERCFQYQKQDVLGKTSIDLGFWRDMSDRKGWIDRFNTDGRVSDYEVTFLMRDGSPRVFMISSERFIYGDEECVLTMSVDVTVRKKLEADLITLNTSLEQRVKDRTRALDSSNRELVLTMESLQHAQKELVQSEKLASLGSMVAGVAHELNTPLGNAMVTASTMSNEVSDMQVALKNNMLKKSTLETFMHRMSEGSSLTQRSVERAVRLVTSFKQVSVDQATERQREFDLSEVVHEVMDTLRPNIRRYGLTLFIDIPKGICLNSYPGPLGQVLMNLVTNSVTHGFDGRKDGAIHVSATALENSIVRLVIRDEGVGIAQQHMGKIFDPFFTTRLGQGGSGLGLSISHRIVTKVLGGRISASSTLGQGACFEFSIPLNAPDDVN